MLRSILVASVSNWLVQLFFTFKLGHEVFTAARVAASQATPSAFESSSNDLSTATTKSPFLAPQPLHTAATLLATLSAGAPSGVVDGSRAASCSPDLVRSTSPTELTS